MLCPVPSHLVGPRYSSEASQKTSEHCKSESFTEVRKKKHKQQNSPRAVKPEPRPPTAGTARSWKWWVTGWRLFVELVSVIGLPMAVYALHPVLSVTSLDSSDLHGNGGSKASITVTGMQVQDVKVQCVTNKVIFEDQDTLALSRFTVIDEYSVSDVSPGESFTADCNFTWSLWTKADGGFFLMGGGVPGKPQLGIPFILSDGLPSFTPGVPIPAGITPDFVGYSSSQVTAIDGYFIVLYKWPLRWLEHQRVIHMIARRRSGDALRWRVAPNSEPVIQDATAGFVVNASAPPNQWAVTMKRGNPN